MACLSFLSIACSGCGSGIATTQTPASAANGILTDGRSTWKLAVVSGALEVEPYHGPLQPTDLYLRDRFGDATYAITLTTDDELTWSTTYAATGADSLPLTDEINGAPHSLTLQDGALSY